MKSSKLQARNRTRNLAVMTTLRLDILYIELNIFYVCGTFRHSRGGEDISFKNETNFDKAWMEVGLHFYC